MSKFEEYQLKILKKQKEKGKGKHYLLLFMFVIILMRFVNEISSNISTYIQSAIVNEFFVSKGMSYEQGLASFSSLSMITSAFVVLSVIYKPLADKIGRKIMMSINICGIAVGMLLAFISGSALTYLIGVAIYSFFTQNDIQMIYIMESAPKDKSASTFAFVKAIGILGLLFVPLERQYLLHNDMSLWRKLYLGPIILCIFIFICFILFMKESDVFIDNRIYNLEHKNEIKEIKENNNLKDSIKYIKSNKALSMSVLAYIFYGICALPAYSYVESLMTINGMSSSDITSAMYIYPFVYAFICFIAGPIADRLGRKIVVIITSLCVATGFIFFIYACAHGFDPHLIGLIEGIYLGSYWVCGDYLSVLFLEKVPTGLRSSVTSGANVLMMLGCIIGIAIQMLLLLKFGLNVATTSIIIPCMLICSIIVILKVKETKGTNLKNIE